MGNWTGKTVEKKEGFFEHNGISYKITDLPGSYSLVANSEEEMVTRDYIASGAADVVCILADASQLERSMYMLADFAGIQVPAVLVLNMIDVAQSQGKQIDAEKIEEQLGITFVFSRVEEVGDMARISFVFDGLMGRLGLQGKSFVKQCFTFFLHLLPFQQQLSAI